MKENVQHGISSERLREPIVLLVDTNVYIDHLAKKQPQCEEWSKLVEMQVSGNAELWISSESFTDAFYVLNGPINPYRLQRLFLKDLKDLHVCSVGYEIVKEAARRNWRDFEDCVIAICAESVGAAYIITRDIRGFAKEQIPCASLSKFLEIIEDRYGLAYGVMEGNAEQA